MQSLRALVICFLVLAIYACKKDGAVNYSITGRVSDADEGTSLEGVLITVEKQVVQNGVFGNTFQPALTTTSNADGNYSGSWSRENFAALRLTATKNQYIPSESNLDIDQLEAEQTIQKELTLYKEAFASIRFQHSDGAESDRLSFTFLNANFNCNCCANGWKVIEGPAVDTSFTCRVYGNRWLKYQVLKQIGFSDSSFVDSIYCPAFITTQRTIDY
jgi:hypothetical protein